MSEPRIIKLRNNLGETEELEVVCKDSINPSHYQQGGIETINYIQSKMSEEGFRGYLRGNILKYISRAELKNGKEDYEKALWYLKKLLEII